MRSDRSTKKGLLAAIALATLAGGVEAAVAQNFPSRPITMIVPFAAGGPADALARVMSERMRTSVGQPVIVENVAGAAGSTGVGRVARASPDGYTIVLGNLGTFVLNGAFYKLQYDLLKDFEPIALLAENPLLITARKDLPAANLQQLVAWLKANPDKASAGTSGVGSNAHVGGIYFQRITGTRFQFIPYRGAAPVIQDLIAGRIDLSFDQASNSIPHVRSGEIKAFAVTAKARLALAPDVPTVDEAGVPGLYMSVWSGLWAPKNTPKEIVQQLNAAVVETLADPVVRQRLGDLGQQLRPREDQSSLALAAFHKAEVEKWWPIVKAANIKVE